MIYNSTYNVYYSIINSNYWFTRSIDFYYITTTTFLVNESYYTYNGLYIHLITIPNFLNTTSDFHSLVEFHQLIVYNNIYKVYFFTKITNYHFNSLNFECLQTIIYLYPNETTLVFFRLESNIDINIMCLTVYIVYPLKLNFMITKLQCFCFSNVLVHSYELIELPILFYVDKLELLNYKIYIFYLLLVL